MMLTTKSRYAVMAVIEVAGNESKLPIKLADISANQNISLNYLEQIFQKLKKANIVSAVKGPGGGYKLIASSDQITIEHIIDAMDENLKMTRCSKDKNCRKNGINCQTHNLWKGLSKQIREYFARISVADIISGKISV
ncbi:MAG: Rrf2 family transcriptional regulator [Rickettsiales bacterium]|nr:MAG: Rrf2 family transcriptional regulator [Rickettsiales bacterium]